MNTKQLLERQAWMLFLRIRWAIEHDYSASVTRRARLRSVLNRSYIRYERRQNQLFDYRSGFLPPCDPFPLPVSGIALSEVLTDIGQGTFL